MILALLVLTESTVLMVTKAKKEKKELVYLVSKEQQVLKAPLGQKALPVLEVEKAKKVNPSQQP